MSCKHLKCIRTCRELESSQERNNQLNQVIFGLQSQLQQAMTNYSNLQLFSKQQLSQNCLKLQQQRIEIENLKEENKKLLKKEKEYHDLMSKLRNEKNEMGDIEMESVASDNDMSDVKDNGPSDITSIQSSNQAKNMKQEWDKLTRTRLDSIKETKMIQPLMINCNVTQENNAGLRSAPVFLIGKNGAAMMIQQQAPMSAVSAVSAVSIGNQLIPTRSLNASNIVNDMKVGHREWNNELVTNIMVRENNLWYYFVPQSQKELIYEFVCCHTNQCQSKLLFSINKHNNSIVNCIRCYKHSCMADTNLKPSNEFSNVISVNGEIAWDQFESQSFEFYDAKNIQAKVQIDASSKNDSNMFDLIFDHFSFEFVNKIKDNSNLSNIYLYKCKCGCCVSNCKIKVEDDERIKKINFLIKHGEKCFECNKDSSMIKKERKQVSIDQSGDIPWNQFLSL